MAGIRWTIALAGMTLSLPALAWQQTGPAMTPQQMPAVTQAQKVDQAGKAFDAMDDDHDGTVSESEINRSTDGYPPRDAPTPAQTIQAADIDGNGKLTREEVQVKASKDFVDDASRNGQPDAGQDKAPEPAKK